MYRYWAVRVFRRLADAGFVVIAPDSLARRYRPLQCDPKTQTGGYNLFVYDFRQAEINYAVQRLLEMPWVASGNMFLVGTSEGGVATALYRGDEFRARVVTQWTCSGRSIVDNKPCHPAKWATGNHLALQPVHQIAQHNIDF